LVSLPPVRRKVGKSGRAPYARQRPARLSAEDRSAILARAESATLRELAAEFGVSHETIRKTLREAPQWRVLTVSG
jgi:transposase